LGRDPFRAINETSNFYDALLLIQPAAIWSGAGGR
jgi:hypothetical protein